MWTGDGLAGDQLEEARRAHDVAGGLGGQDPVGGEAPAPGVPRGERDAAGGRVVDRARVDDRAGWDLGRSPELTGLGVPVVAQLIEVVAQLIEAVLAVGARLTPEAT